MLFPRLRFRYLGPYIQRQQRWQRPNPKHRPPSPHRQQKSRGNRRQQIADRITTLQNSTQDSSQLHRSRFHRQRSAHSPFPAHANSKQRAQNQKHRKIRRETASQLNERKINHVSHQRNSSPISIRKQAKQQRSHGTHRQSRRCRHYNFFFADPKLPRQRVEQKHHHKKIKRIQRPTQETRQYRVMRPIRFYGICLRHFGSRGNVA